MYCGLKHGDGFLQDGLLQDGLFQEVSAGLTTLPFRRPLGALPYDRTYFLATGTVVKS